MIALKGSYTKQSTNVTKLQGYVHNMAQTTNRTSTNGVDPNRVVY
jgi:hypothetical protein